MVCSMSGPLIGRLCDQCGENLATHARGGYDVTPTDRGDERRYIEDFLCDDCDKEAA